MISRKDLTDMTEDQLRDLVRMVNEELKIRQAELAQNLFRGCRVEWTSSKTGQVLHGTITKKKLTSADIICEETGDRWNVSYSFLNRA